MVQELTIDDFLGNGRYAFRIPRREKKRRKLKKLVEESDIPFHTLGHLMIEHGISPFDDKSRYTGFDRKYDCRDWAFDSVGLPHYTNQVQDRVVYEIILRDLPDLHWASDPALGDVVVYFKKDQLLSYGNDHSSIIKSYKFRDSVKHWGVVSHVKGEVRVQSKWGRNHVYSHPIGLVPHTYGNHVMFARRTE